MQRQTAGVLEVRGPTPARSPWQKLADGGKAVGGKVAHGGKKIGDGGKTIGTKAARAGQATAGAVTRFGSAIARAFGGGP